MSKSTPYNHYDYLTKKEILELEDFRLIRELVSLTEHRMKIENRPNGRVPLMLIKNVSWIEEEILTRMK